MTSPGDFVEQHERAKATLHGIRAEGNTTEQQQHAARLYVCGRAKDAEDARELLLALGLLEQDFSWSQTPHNSRKKVVK